MSLAENWPLGTGSHIASVADFRLFTFNSGNAGVEFTLVVGDQQIKSDGFSLMPKALWKLAQFAQACGITREEAAKYNPENDASHQMLVGRYLRIEVGKNNEGYLRVKDWEPLGKDDKVPASQPVPPQPVAPTAAPIADAPPTGDAIPF